MSESKALASMADLIQSRTSAMPPSPARDSLLVKANAMSALSAKKYQQAQEN